MSTISPNMHLVISTISVDSGLAWETNLNASLSIVDGHNHTPGYGVQIPPAGLNINSALTFQGNQATNLGATIFSNISSLATPNALYTIGGELWYNDPTNPIQLTANGSVNVTSTSLTSGTASASFSSSVLVVNSAANTPADIQVGSVLMGNTVANSKFLTLNPPAAMAANIQQTLPTIPASTSFMTMDSSGNMAASIVAPLTGSNIASATVARSNQVAVGQQISPSCHNFSTSSSSFVSVTNLSVTITTSGRPVHVFLISDGSTSAALLEVQASSVTSVAAACRILSGSTEISRFQLATQPTGGSITNTYISIPSGCINHLDVPAAGTYTYTVQLLTNAGSVYMSNSMLVAYEL